MRRVLPLLAVVAVAYLASAACKSFAKDALKMRATLSHTCATVLLVTSRVFTAVRYTQLVWPFTDAAVSAAWTRMPSLCSCAIAGSLSLQKVHSKYQSKSESTRPSWRLPGAAGKTFPQELLEKMEREQFPRIPGPAETKFAVVGFQQFVQCESRFDVHLQLNLQVKAKWSCSKKAHGEPTADAIYSTGSSANLQNLFKLETIRILIGRMKFESLL